MCVFKKIKNLQSSVDELTKIVKTQELVRLRNESKELKQIKELLSKIHIDVKSVDFIQDGNLCVDALKIKYSIPDVTLYFDDNNEPYRNEPFYSINMLNLISLEDMKKIKTMIDSKKTLDTETKK